MQLLLGCAAFEPAIRPVLQLVPWLPFVIVGDERKLAIFARFLCVFPLSLCAILSAVYMPNYSLLVRLWSRAETATKTGMIMIFGEITTKAVVNYEQVIRDAIKHIGYDDVEKGLDYKTVNVIVAIEEQSPDIAQSVHVGKALEDIGAGDQGIMFGYATDETEDAMPMSHHLATRIGYRLTEVRKNGTCPWVRPDGKTQVNNPASLSGCLVCF